MSPQTSDICRNYHKGADTSVAAHTGTPVQHRITLREKVFCLLIGSADTGLTCDEVEVILGRTHQTVSARITELVAEGRIRDSFRRRPTRSGRQARVYIAGRRSNGETV